MALRRRFLHVMCEKSPPSASNRAKTCTATFYHDVAPPAHRTSRPMPTISDRARASVLVAEDLMGHGARRRLRRTYVVRTRAATRPMSNDTGCLQTYLK